MATPQRVTRRVFLSNLRRSGLFSREQLDSVGNLAPDTDRGRLLARTLVERGLLTRFQAERLLVGRTDGFLLDQYVILEELGRGGMGRVYKARHRRLGRTVALKILAPTLTRTERARQLFLHEVRAISQLAHPNIVAAYDANQVGDRFFLVLEYVDGPNLEKLVRQQGPLEVGQACDFVRQAAQGLNCAHNAGMVHRDIKPGNLLLQLQGPELSPLQAEEPESPERSRLPADEPESPKARRRADGGATTLRAESGGSGRVKVSDFGLARLHGPGERGQSGTILTRPNMVMGTPDFLSPEQARNLHDTDIRSDLYSLGCSLHFLLTGQVPFPGGTSVEKLIRHNTEEPTPIEQLRPDVPAEVAEIVRRLLRKAPAERFQTPLELAAALEPFSVSGPTPWESRRAALDSLPELATPFLDDSDPLMPMSAPVLPEIPDPTQASTPVSDALPTVPMMGSASDATRWKQTLTWGLIVAGGVLGLAAACSALLSW